MQTTQRQATRNVSLHSVVFKLLREGVSTLAHSLIGYRRQIPQDLVSAISYAVTEISNNEKMKLVEKLLYAAPPKKHLSQGRLAMFWQLMLPLKVFDWLLLVREKWLIINCTTGSSHEI